MKAFLFGLLAFGLIINTLAQTNSNNDQLFRGNNRNINYNPTTNYLPKSDNPGFKLDSISYASPRADLSFWVTDKDYFYYNDQGQNNLIISKTISEDGNMSETGRTDITYTNNQIDEIIAYYLSLASHERYNSSRIKCTYNSFNLIDSIKTDIWNSEDSVWTNMINVDYIYNSLNMVSSTIHKQVGINNIITLTRNDYFYNPNDSLIAIEKYTFDTLTQLMTLNFRTNMIYQNRLLVCEENAYPYPNNTMKVTNRKKYVYNNDNTVQSDYREYFSVTDDRWVIREKNDYEYNPDLIPDKTALSAEMYLFENTARYYGIKLPVEVTYYNNYDAWMFGDGQKLLYYSKSGSNLPNLEAGTHWQVYPNPANDFVYLDSDQQIHANYTLMDASGRIILMGNIETGYSIDLKTLKAGCYILQLSDQKNNQQSIKIIKR